MFVGRHRELAALDRLRSKSTASLFVCKGRRRVGKSRLVVEFGKKFDRFLEFQGLSPREGQDNAAQLSSFAAQLAKQTALPRVGLDDWTQAFELLDSQVGSEPTLILLDEVSWFGRYDPDFAGKLKIAWDTMFSRKDRLVLGVCGSVSSWIEENILHNTNFVGRIASTILLKPLPLRDCAAFWQMPPTAHVPTSNEPAIHKIAAFEKIKFLCVTGGIPRYLEELDPSMTAEQNIDQLCFRPEGFLFAEMSRIFDDSFDPAKTIYRSIVGVLQRSHANYSELASTLKIRRGGTLTQHLDHLEQSGFCSKDIVWGLDGKPKKSARYRLSDNYLRFYLRCIQPNQAKISQNVGAISVDRLPAWRSILGYQFENLIFNEFESIINALGIDPQHVISVGPYLQRASTGNNGCQIDLLIHTKFDCLYVCELKLRRRIDRRVIKEVGEKLRCLKRPKYLSVRPVLLYAGDLDEEVLAAEVFYRCLDVGSLLER